MNLGLKSRSPPKSATENQRYNNQIRECITNNIVVVDAFGTNKKYFKNCSFHFSFSLLLFYFVKKGRET